MASVEITQIAAQAMGVVACGTQLAATRCRNTKVKMLVICASHIIFAVSFFMLGLISGMALSIVSAVMIFWTQFSKNNTRASYSVYLWSEVAAAVILSSVVVSYTMPQNGWVEVFSLCGVLLTLLAVICKNQTLSRIFFLASAICWLVYNVVGFAIGAILSQVINAVFHVKAILNGGY